MFPNIEERYPGLGEVFLGVFASQVSPLPNLATPYPVVQCMLQMAGVRKKDVLYDLGSGDGRILITAVQQFGVKAVGVELNDSLVRWTISRVERLDFQDKIHILRTNFFTVDLREADVVTMYLGNEANHLLRPKFEKELRPGTRVVSHHFQVEDWEPLEVSTLLVPETERNHTVYLYRMPQKARSSTVYRR